MAHIPFIIFLFAQRFNFTRASFYLQYTDIRDNNFVEQYNMCEEKKSLYLSKYIITNFKS